MNIDIKKSTKPVKYHDAINFLEKRVVRVNEKKSNELIWLLEHPSVFTAGKRHKKSEILDKKIKIIKTSRGGKITWHGPGQLICYFVIDLNNRHRDVRKFINLIEITIIETLKKYDIKSFSDRNNIGIWINKNNKLKKIGAIGIKIKKWIAYHGFSINIDNDLNSYNKIIPCGIYDKEITNLVSIKKQNYKKLKNYIVSNFIKNLKKKVF
tara:strand:+ start:602 stop:1231 length:630 start_codon:yes stop_codon:yes gene_type:complete